MRYVSGGGGGGGRRRSSGTATTMQTRAGARSRRAKVVAHAIRAAPFPDAAFLARRRAGAAPANQRPGAIVSPPALHSFLSPGRPTSGRRLAERKPQVAGASGGAAKEERPSSIDDDDDRRRRRRRSFACLAARKVDATNWICANKWLWEEAEKKASTSRPSRGFGLSARSGDDSVAAAARKIGRTMQNGQFGRRLPSAFASRRRSPGVLLGQTRVRFSPILSCAL